MKKASEYLNRLYITKDGEPSSVHDSVENVLNVIKQAQKDAIRETVKECAESATITYDDYDDFINGEETYIVDKKSILSVADKLIKEI